MVSRKESQVQKEVKVFPLTLILEIVGGYRFAGNSYEIYEKFFGTTNPFADTLENDGRDQYGSIFGDAFGGKSQRIPDAP